MALSVFSVVVNKDVRVSDLSLDDLRRLYSGRIANWNQLPGGPDLPVRLVSRDAKSGTRGVLESRVLERNEISRTSDNCRAPKFTGDTVVRCELDSTGEVLKTVANTPGAIGYAELHSAEESARQGDLHLVALAHRKPSIRAVRERSYPFWEPEYAYTYTAPPANPPVGTQLCAQVVEDRLRDGGWSLVSADSADGAPVGFVTTTPPNPYEHIPHGRKARSGGPWDPPGRASPQGRHLTLTPPQALLTALYSVLLAPYSFFAALSVAVRALA
ncbi:substrate-binding domain-containing protein [Streptomyces sp. NPDC019937]|uniref:substrate-binding domain-containing protein n=1 Tax=Streptomyces sp. NPDC019937 TaxID=3154787 RepID=UPI0033E31D8C